MNFQQKAMMQQQQAMLQQQQAMQQKAMMQQQAMQQQGMVMPQQQGMVMPQQGMVQPAYIKTVQLPDGTLLQRQLTALVIVTPIGKTITMSPPPSYSPVSDKMDYISKKGHAEKLAYEKTLGKVSWKNRFIVLAGQKINVFEKEKDSKPKEEITINGWAKATEKDSPKRKDAHSFSSNHNMVGMMTKNIGEMMSDTDGTVGKEHSLEVHQLADNAQMMDNLMHTSAMGLAFGGSKKVTSQSAITFYFHFSSDTERNEWLQAIDNNKKAYFASDDYLADVKKTFCTYLKNIGVDGDSFDWRKILNELYL